MLAETFGNPAKSFTQDKRLVVWMGELQFDKDVPIERKPMQISLRGKTELALCIGLSDLLSATPRIAQNDNVGQSFTGGGFYDPP